MTLAQIHTALEKHFEKTQELMKEEGFCADEVLGLINAGALSINDLCEKAHLTPDVVAAIMKNAKDAEKEEFMHRVVNGVKYVIRKKHVALGESGWTPGFEG